MSDSGLIRRRDVLAAIVTKGLIGENTIRALPADAVAAAALRLAETLNERDQLVAANPLDAIEDRGGWAARVAGLLAAYRAARGGA